MYEDLIKALQCCGSSPHVDRCKSECKFFRTDLNMSKCIPDMADACADALSAADKQIATLRAENERIRQNSVSHEVYQQLADELAKVKPERDTAIEGMKIIADTYRESVGDDGICGLCEHDGPAEHKCPGFVRDDCFKWRGTTDLSVARKTKENEHG